MDRWLLSEFCLGLGISVRSGGDGPEGESELEVISFYYQSVFHYDVHSDQDIYSLIFLAYAQTRPCSRGAVASY